MVRAFAHDEEGVSEVIGYILSFAILSAVLLIAMLTFNVARSQAEDRLEGVEAASIAHRIASALVETQAFADGRPTTTATNEVRIVLELPQQVESQGYSIQLCAPGAATRCTTSCSGALATHVQVSISGNVALESLLGVKAMCGNANGGRLATCYQDGSVVVQPYPCSSTVQAAGLFLVPA